MISLALVVGTINEKRLRPRSRVGVLLQRLQRNMGWRTGRASIGTVSATRHPGFETKALVEQLSPVLACQCPRFVIMWRLRQLRSS